MGKVFVCYGKDCRRAKGFDGLCRAVGRHQRVRCQKVCDGPVAGFELNGVLSWFDKLRSPKRWASLDKARTSGRMGERLAKRHRKKRDGKRRK